MFSQPAVCCTVLFLSNHTDTETCKSGNFHGALSSTGQHADPLVVCMCESHVKLRGKEVCRPLVWMKRMSSLAFRECCSSIFFFFCMFQCCALYHRCVIHALFLQSYLLLCNWLFSRHQTFLSKDTNVCSVVMDMLGSQMRRVAHCCRCGCSFFLFISDTVDFFY